MLAYDFALAYASVTGGLLWDEETRECFSQSSWAKRRESGWDGGVPVVERHITIDFYRHEPLYRAVTLGMRKFGLPDLCIEQLGHAHSRSAGNLINCVGQALEERGCLDAPGRLMLDLRSLKAAHFRDGMVESLKSGGTGKGDVDLSLAEPQDGDAKNRLLELRFDRKPGTSEMERLSALVADLFGSEDSLSAASNEDAELVAARDRARTKLREIVKPSFLRGLPQGESLTVKAPFRTASGGTEWMWVEVVEWKAGELSGILDSDPYEVPGLHAGAQVSVREDSLFDYILTLPDGRREGNETGEILRRREGR